jgi:hypothetical protein
MRFISQDENKEDYFITHDQKYIIKTISRKEHQTFLKEILKPYHKRVIEGSFLQRIYGFYKLTYNGEYVRVMVLKNPHIDQQVHTKPSYVGKSVQSISSLDYSLNPEFLTLQEKEKTRFYETIDRDLCFLRSLKVLTFSILVIITSCSSDDLFTFKAESEKYPVWLSVVITHFFCGDSMKNGKKSQDKEGDLYEDTKDTLNKLIS